MYYKQIENDSIIAIGTLSIINDNVAEITETEYNSLLLIIANKPVDTLEYIYRLSAETNQYEPFTRTHDETVDWYVGKILNEEMTINDVPETYREEVKAKLPVPPEQTYTLDEAATIIAQEVSAG